ncbi:MAG: M67 family metallopeptidase [Mariprofundales bacterium]
MQYEPIRFSSAAYRAAIDLKNKTASTTVAQGVIPLMRSHAIKGYPHEICGLLIGKFSTSGWQIDEAIPVPNINTERVADRFQLDPKIYKQTDTKLRGTGREIIGVYHSHPDCPAKPSPTDVEHAWDGWCYIIISVAEKQVVDISFWALNDAGTAFSASSAEVFS